MQGKVRTYQLQGTLLGTGLQYPGFERTIHLDGITNQAVEGL